MYGQLRIAHTRFKACLDSVSQVTPENTQKTSLLPLTASLYVPGRISDPNTVIVDIGTGYYVEKSTTDAKRFYADKLEYLDKNLSQLQETIERKQDNLRVVGEVMQVKLLQQRAAT
ncbi:subunit of tubulin prefoldin [Malassezia cuniculi]|uniref:Subunit of tubulin prefoldin n=1 Tax=Malassezia cuniculi TaxID=948313 RepID=A0AAF0JCY1_9BASI|nr:subunit of tubulin prefoldin [Malassezia cuniculi]